METFFQPPSPSDLLAGITSEPEPIDEVSPSQRLLLAPKISKVPVEAARPEPDVAVAPVENINLTARQAQYRETDASPDPDAVWRKLSKPVLRDRPGQLLQRLQGGAALQEPEWDELKATLQQVASATQEVPDDLKVGRGEVSSVYQAPTGTWMTVDYPGDLSPEDLPGSLTGKPNMAVTEETLEWPSNGEFSVFVGPTDVVYAATPTPENEARLRGLAPGPVGKDGVPRWVPVEPLPVPSPRAVEAAAVASPGTVIDAYVAKDSYVGTKGGDWIVWDVPDTGSPKVWRPPVWMQGRATKVRGGVATSQPKYALTPVGKDKIVDQQTLNLRLDDTSWAVFEAQGDPKATSRMVGTLKRQGLEPIELASEGRRAWLVFGADPSQVRGLSPKRPVYTNDGVIGDDEPEPREFEFSTPSGRVRFGSRPGLTAGAIPRTQARQERWAFKVDPDQLQRLTRFADDIEATGGTNVAVYARQNDIDGFQRAKEHLFSDGTATRVVRTTSSHGPQSNTVPVFVRSTTGLPSEPPEIA